MDPLAAVYYCIFITLVYRCLMLRYEWAASFSKINDNLWHNKTESEAETILIFCQTNTNSLSNMDTDSWNPCILLKVYISSLSRVGSEWTKHVCTPYSRNTLFSTQQTIIHHGEHYLFKSVLYCTLWPCELKQVTSLDFQYKINVNTLKTQYFHSCTWR